MFLYLIRKKFGVLSVKSPLIGVQYSEITVMIVTFFIAIRLYFFYNITKLIKYLSENVFVSNIISIMWFFLFIAVKALISVFAGGGFLLFP